MSLVREISLVQPVQQANRNSPAGAELENCWLKYILSRLFTPVPSGDRKESEWIGIVTCSVSASTLRKPWTQWPFPTACLWTFATHLEEHPHCCCGLQVWNQQLRGGWFPESYWSKLTNKRAFVYSTLSLCRLAGLAPKGFPISVWATRICFRHLKSMSIWILPFKYPHYEGE